MTPEICIWQACPADIAKLKPVIDRAYRGDSARLGWTHEADLLSDERIGMDDLTALTKSKDTCLLIAYDGDTPIGCVAVTQLKQGRAYLGLLCIDPLLQAQGLGRQLIAAAETTARDAFGAKLMEMTVIDQRQELIAYYERRGYVQSGELRDFPVPIEPPLKMAVLEKPLY